MAGYENHKNSGEAKDCFVYLFVCFAGCIAIFNCPFPSRAVEWPIFLGGHPGWTPRGGMGGWDHPMHPAGNLGGA